MVMKKAGSSVTQPQEITAGAAGVATGAQEQMIAVAAYYLAEQRGFLAGQELEDWLLAEKEVASRAASEDS